MSRPRGEREDGSFAVALNKDDPCGAMFDLEADAYKHELIKHRFGPAKLLRALRARTRVTRCSAKFQGKKYCLWEFWRMQGNVPSLGEARVLCGTPEARIESHVVKVRERNIGTRVPGAFSGLSLFKKSWQSRHEDGFWTLLE